MRKLVSHMHVSLDGYAAGPKGEMNWIKLDEEMFDFVKTLTDAADAALYGRNTWEMMDAYWPDAANHPNASKHDRDHSAWYNNTEKYVLSGSKIGQQKKGVTFIDKDIEKEISKLKEKQGKDILMLGSPMVTRSLMKANLIDEYWLFLNPVILGNGIPVFSPLQQPKQLQLAETKNFSCGVTALKYRTGF